MEHQSYKARLVKTREGNKEGKITEVRVARTHGHHQKLGASKSHLPLITEERELWRQTGDKGYTARSLGSSGGAVRRWLNRARLEKM